MESIKNIEKVISIYNAWKPSDIAYVKYIEWSNNNLEIIFYSQIRSSINGWTDTSKELFEISIKFVKVCNLKLHFLSADIQQIAGFDILDVSSNGLENINFKIEDYENGILDFDCEEIFINSISDPILIIPH